MQALEVTSLLALPASHTFFNQEGFALLWSLVESEESRTQQHAGDLRGNVRFVFFLVPDSASYVKLMQAQFRTQASERGGEAIEPTGAWC